MRHKAKFDRLLRVVGQRMREHRLKANLRQEDVEDYGVSWKHYQKIESGQTNTTVRILYKLAKAFKCEAKDLLP